MKPKILYIMIAICLVIITVLLTILVMSNKINKNDSQTTSHTHQSQKQNLPINYSRYPIYDDIDYAYDYDGYWFQPSRWWNNLWTNRRYNMYNRRDNYHRRDGLDTHNRYIHNSININPVPAPSHQGIPVPQSGTIQPSIIQPSINQPSINQNGLSLSEGTNSSLLSPPPPEGANGSLELPPPSPYLSSVMPEEVAMSPMSPMSNLSQSENIVQTISTFVSDISESYPTSYPTNYTTGYVSNLNYKGPDLRNHKPFPVDMMASESIYLQPNTVANQIIVPPIVKHHPNPN